MWNKKYTGKLVMLAIFIYGLFIAGCTPWEAVKQEKSAGNNQKELHEPSPVEEIPPVERDVYDLVLLGARSEVTRQVRYDASYRQIDYPGGDVSPEVGACADVVIRAFRNAGIDLQKLVHEDMEANFDKYPQNWGLDGPDPNIDHRRVPNLVKFFQRKGQELTIQVNEDTLTEWHWGDVVFWRFDNGLDHCGIVSDRKNESGIPLVIHNAGMAREEDCLTRWQITGHFRYPEVSR